MNINQHLKTTEQNVIVALKKLGNTVRTNFKWKAIILPLFLLISISFTNSLQAQGPVLQWAKAQGGAGWDNGYAITVDDVGNSYTTGLFRADGDFDPGPGVYTLAAQGSTGANLFISKLNPQGDFVWAKKFGSIKFNFSYGIAHDAQGNVYAVGNFFDSIDFDPGPNEYFLSSTATPTKSDAFVVKLDSAGNFVWAKSFGGTLDDNAYSVHVDKFNNVYVTGKFLGTVDFDPGPGVFNIVPSNLSANNYILKLNSAGDFVWAKNMGQATPTLATGVGFSITVDKVGNVYSTGYFRDSIDFDPGVGVAKLGSRGLDDVFISKLDSAGNYVWAKSVGSSRADQGLCITLDAEDDNVYVTGIFNDSVDFDPGVGVLQLKTVSSQNSNIFILKLDKMGAFVWAKSIEGEGNTASENSYAFSTLVDKGGNTLTTGYFYGTADFDPGIGVTTASSFGSTDVFLLKLTPAGDFKWVKTFNGPDIVVSRSSAIDASGNLYTTGWFKGTVDFDPSSVTNYLTSASLTQPDIMVVKLSCGDTSSTVLVDTADCAGYLFDGTNRTTSGIYTQVLQNSEGCDSSINLHLTIVPIVAINVVRNSNILSTVETFTTYKWMLNGQLITGATNSTYTVTQNGDYRVIVTNANACMDTSSVFTVSDFTGVDDLSEIASLIKIYPNPATDVVNIQSPIIVNVDVTGVEGRLIMSIKNAKNFSIKSLATGIYLLRVTDKNGIWIQTVKIVKQ